MEAIRKEKEPLERQQPQPEDEAPKLPQRQRSVRPILTFSLEVRQVHQEQVESSEPLNSNVVVLDLLKAMKQELEKRDSQLKLQLKLKDEYMEAELKRRDQYLEEALN